MADKKFGLGKKIVLFMLFAVVVAALTSLFLTQFHKGESAQTARNAARNRYFREHVSRTAPDVNPDGTTDAATTAPVDPPATSAPVGVDYVYLTLPADTGGYNPVLLQGFTGVDLAEAMLTTRAQVACLPDPDTQGSWLASLWGGPSAPGLLPDFHAAEAKQLPCGVEFIGQQYTTNSFGTSPDIREDTQNTIVEWEGKVKFTYPDGHEEVGTWHAWFVKLLGDSWCFYKVGPGGL